MFDASTLIYLPTLFILILNCTLEMNDTTTKTKPEEKEILLDGNFLPKSPWKLPAGIINKQYTGIGATTRELEDISRNSVIVVPTRSLAATKAKEGVFYLGSKFEDRFPDSLDVIKTKINDGERVKIMAVADSFKNVFLDNRDFFYNNFHLLIDEADSFQSESTYRTSLSDCIDIYKSFPREQRTMISATISEFSDEGLSDDQRYIVKRKKKQPLQLTLAVSEGDFDADLAKLIQLVLEKEPEKKVLVAYNYITGILRTIACLSDKLSIGVLCSAESTSKIPKKYRTRIKNGRLDHQVTFMTSAYFVGIDIYDNANVISAANPNIGDFTILTENKIIQTLGRVRDADHLNFFLFKLSREGKSMEIRNLEREIKKSIDEYQKCLTSFVKLQNRLNSKVKGYDRVVDERLLSVTEFLKINLLRLSALDGSIVPNYLGVDYILNQYTAINEIYTHKNKALNHFRKQERYNVTDIKTLNEQFSEEAQTKYDLMIDQNKEELVKLLRSYILPMCGLLTYGILDLNQIPKKYIDVIEEFEHIGNVTGDCLIVKQILEEKLDSRDLDGLFTLAYQMKFLLCWKTQNNLLKRGLEDLISSVTHPKYFSLGELRYKIDPLEEFIKKEVSDQLLDISNDHVLKRLLENLFVIDRKKKSKKYRFVAAKSAKDYLQK